MPVAQVNIAKMLAPPDDPVMIKFVDNLDRLNKLAEESTGFIWRFGADNSDKVKTIRLDNHDHILVNLSVWDNVDDLFDYVYKTTHADILKRKGEWFTTMRQMHMALWYVRPGQFPDLEDALKRLEHIREHGETPYAFTFKKRFSEDDFISYPSSVT
jgi:hypothetical protein